MALIEKNELVYKDYSWTTYGNEDPRITRKLDSTILNRKEGYEMLYFINRFAKINDFKNKLSGFKVEELIINEVPENIHTQEKIKLWIMEHW